MANKTEMSRPEAENVKDGKVQKLKKMASSLVIAIVVWFVIINVVNPNISVKIQDVPVRYVGENILRERGLVLVNKEELSKFEVKVSGTRNELLDGRERIRVDIDVSGIQAQGEIAVNPSVSGPENIRIEKKNFSSVNLSVEPSYEKRIPIIVNQSGDELQKEKGKIVFSVPTVDELMIVGSKRDVSQVYGCVVTVDVSGISETGETMYSYFLVDSEKNIISSPATVYCSSVTVPVNNMVYKRKTCPVKVEIPESLSKHYTIDVDEKSLSPAKIDIGVAEGTEIPDELVAVFKDGDYKSGSGEFVLEIEPEDGIFVTSSAVSVKAEITKLKEITEKVKIKITNVPEGLKVANETVEQEMKLFVPDGYEKEIKATADASGCTAGEAALKIKFDDKKIKASEGNTVNVYFEGVISQ